MGEAQCGLDIHFPNTVKPHRQQEMLLACYVNTVVCEQLKAGMRYTTLKTDWLKCSEKKFEASELSAMHICPKTFFQNFELFKNGTVAI